jgi:MtN3 and saliva related transmembrane protein
MDSITIVGIAASIGTAVSLIPQLIKIIKEKRAEAISFGMMIILFAGLGLWHIEERHDHYCF